MLWRINKKYSFKRNQAVNFVKLYFTAHNLVKKWTQTVHQLVCKSKSKGSSSTVASASTTKSKKKNADDYEVLQNRGELGQGSYGIVMLVRDKQTSQYFAMKIMPKKQIFKYCSVENLKMEIKIQRKLDHPHITKLYNYFEDTDNVYLILEYAELGSLFNTLKKKRQLSEDEAFFYFFQTCLGIDYLHKKQIIHRDLKPENLLLDKYGNIKICDFGWSTDAMSKSRTSFCGTVEYMPPEMVRKEDHNFKLDIWGLGILLYELLHGKPPFNGRNDQEKFSSILNNKKIQFSPNLGEEVVNLIRVVLNPNPKERPTICEIFKLKWMVQKQTLHKVNLLDYLWDDRIKPKKMQELNGTEGEVKKSKIIQETNINERSRVSSMVQSQRVQTQSQKNDLQYGSGSCRTYNSPKQSYQKINMSTSEIIALYSKGQKTPVQDTNQQFQNQLVKKKEEWELRRDRSLELENMITVKSKRPQSQRQDVGFFEKLFTTLGCLNRSRMNDQIQ